MITTVTCSGSSQSNTSLNPFYVGGDISALTVIEDKGGIFRDEGTSGDAIEIMQKYGSNCFRLRLFVNPTMRNVVVQDTDYTIALAGRIKASGADLLLDFHYSDTWADPGHQSKPAAWRGLDFSELARTVYTYTRESITAFRQAGLCPEMVQVGNEITPGMLWPDGKLYGTDHQPDEQWEKLTRLLKAGIQGVRDGAGQESVRIIIHIDKGGDADATEHFFTKIQEHGVPYDIIGLSYYPWWHGSMEDLRKNLTRTSKKFDKDIFVVETAYPWQDRTMSRGNVDKNMEFPKTPQGQAAFLTELIGIVRRTPDGKGIGVLWWYPESIPVEGLYIWNGGATALFDTHGNTLPALKQFSGEPK
jgi:arabinogalactan endo-1,4-beta-galactosidase